MPSADDLISASEFKASIDEALDDDDFEALATYYGQLLERHPDSFELAEKEVEALQRRYAWAEADRKAQEALQKFPSSSRAGILWAHAAFYARDWRTAADRFGQLAQRFDPRTDRSVAATILTHFLCCYNMADAKSAKLLIENNWRKLLYHSSASYNNVSEIYEIREFVPKEFLCLYDTWLGETLPLAAGGMYRNRVAANAAYQNWIGYHAPDVSLIGLGQNCLPWVLPNRWGLRPGHFTLDPFGPLDFMAAPKDAAARLIEAGFAPLRDRSAFTPSRYPNKVPVLLHNGIGTSFYHEQGPWWAEDDWSRLHQAYGKRIANIQKARSSGKQIYFYCICGEGDHSRLIKAYEDHLSSASSRLLIVNVLKAPIPIETDCSHIVYRHIPYPADYGWNSWTDFDTARGHAFELEIIETLRTLLLDLKDWRTLIARNRARVARLSSMRLKGAGSP